MKNRGYLISYGKSVELDEKDQKILKVLDKKSRSSIADISRKTGIPRDTVLYRMRKMKKRKVIRFYHTVLNPSILGYPVYTFVNFTLHNFDQEKEKKFLMFLKTHPNITYVAKTSGKWDIIINVASNNLKHFDEIMTQIRVNYSDLIKDYESSSIIQEYKYDDMTGLIR